MTGPTFTTTGNNSFAVHNWFSNNPFTVGTELATLGPTREYTYPWTNQWLEQRCNPDTTFTSPQRNDIDASRANLFAMHNREHDWAYHLGFTEALWNTQGQLRAVWATTSSRATRRPGNAGAWHRGSRWRGQRQPDHPGDGIAPITNMYLWQPIAGAYSRCVDGDFDMSVIARVRPCHHQPDDQRPGRWLQLATGHEQSWSDLIAMEYLNEHGAAPGIRAYTIGEYVTTDPIAGIRNYNMSQSLSTTPASTTTSSDCRCAPARPGADEPRQVRDDRSVRCRHAGTAEVLREWRDTGDVPPG